MKLRPKIFILLISVFAIIFFVIIYQSHHLLIKQFNLLEQAKLTENMLRAESTINRTLTSLETLSSDWAHWDDAYNFMTEKNPNFVKINLSSAFFEDTKINFVLFYTSQKKLYFAKSYNFAKKRFIELPLSLLTQIEFHQNLLNHKSICSRVSGFLKTSKGILALTSTPITTSEKQGPLKGTLIMAYYFDDIHTQELADTLRLPVTLFTLPLVNSHNVPQNIAKNLNEKTKFLTQINNENTISGFFPLQDINRKNIGIFRVDYPRYIYKQGIKTINYFIFHLCLIAIVVVLLIWFALKSMFLDRLFELISHIQTMTEKNNFSAKLNDSTSDELGSLTKSLNKMLDVINVAQEKTHAILLNEIERKEAAEEKVIAKEKILTHLAHHDALTDLPNKALFNELLNRSISHAKRYEHQLAVFFLDLDRFKFINDALGHDAGDEYLQKLATAFLQKTRSIDVVSRFSSDEFLFFVSEYKDIVDIEKIAQRILDIVVTPQIIKNQRVEITGSIGISIYPQDGLTLEELINKAEIAMYKAKEEGKAQYHFFKELMNVQAKETLRLESDLRDALKNSEIMVFFQPIFQLSDLKIIGLEALARWNHPELGLILPNKFIGLAEKTNLIFSLGEHILIEALHTQKKWKEKGLNPGFISVNFSPLQFKSQWFIESIKRTITENRASINDLVVEITESILMDAEEASIDKLKQLNQLGVKIAIDDFGTGYSSLNYLQKFPLHYLKIDREFIKNILSDNDGATITKAIIALSHSLNLTTIAEGIETYNQLNLLKSFDCPLGQGYLISRPLNKNDMEALLIKLKENNA